MKINSKAFVSLKLGENRIEIKTENCNLMFIIFHKLRIQKNDSHYLRVLYVVCDDDSDGHFQSPKNDHNSIDDALKRISFSAQLLQTFISESIYKEFGSRKTFNFFSNERICQVFRSKIKLNEALDMRPDELFLLLANEIKSKAEIFNCNSKYLAVLSFTRLETNTQLTDNDFTKMKGFCAIGLQFRY
jgi:hypothetical protein